MKYMPIVLLSIPFCLIAIFIYYSNAKRKLYQANKALQLANEQHQNAEKIIREEQFRKSQIQKLYSTRMASLQEKSKQVRKEREILNEALKEANLGFPWIGQFVAEANAAYLNKTAIMLETKKRPALKAAEKVKEISSILRTEQKAKLIAQAQLSMYETLFPWLEEFKEVPVEAVKVCKTEQTNDPASRYLTSHENDLSKAEKFQLALNRYWKRQKSNWEIGRDYERFIGYKYETAGYEVVYVGAVQGFEDMGRDIIAKRECKTNIVQCKYWSKAKTIHEKHIFQLYGTTVSYCIDQAANAGASFSAYQLLETARSIIPVFVTSTTLSETAREVAQALRIEVRENMDMESFPSIKCHVSQSTKEKIYHLPFDQQYDRIKMKQSNGDCYVSTVKEAEKQGFRRAFKWKGDG